MSYLPRHHRALRTVSLVIIAVVLGASIWTRLIVPQWLLQQHRESLSAKSLDCGLALSEVARAAPLLSTLSQVQRDQVERSNAVMLIVCDYLKAEALYLLSRHVSDEALRGIHRDALLDSRMPLLSTGAVTGVPWESRR